MNQTTYPDRAAWLAARKKGIGASDAVVVMGLSRFRGPLELWSEKVGLADPDAAVDQPLRIRLGNALEPVVAMLTEQESGKPIVRTPFTIITDPERPHLLCSPDGFVVDEEPPFRRVALVELKVQDIARAEEWAEGPPEEYAVQVQHALGVTGLPYCVLGALIGTREFRWCRVERDEERIAEIRAACDAFWRLVETEAPPAPTGHEGDTRALMALHPRPEDGKAIPLGADFLGMTTEAEGIRAQRRVLDDREAEIKNAIRAALGDAEVGVLPGDGGVWRWRLERRKGFTVEPSESRVLRFSRKGGR